MADKVVVLETGREEPAHRGARPAVLLITLGTEGTWNCYTNHKEEIKLTADRIKIPQRAETLALFAFKISLLLKSVI